MSHQIRQVKGSSATKVRHSEPRGPKPTFTRKTSAAAERELVDVTHTEPMTTGFDLIFQLFDARRIIITVLSNSFDLLQTK